MLLPSLGASAGAAPAVAAAAASVAATASAASASAAQPAPSLLMDAIIQQAKKVRMLQRTDNQILASTVSAAQATPSLLMVDIIQEAKKVRRLRMHRQLRLNLYMFGEKRNSKLHRGYSCLPNRIWEFLEFSEVLEVSYTSHTSSQSSANCHAGINAATANSASKQCRRRRAACGHVG